MLIIGESLVSEDILEKKFVCHLEKCKGACCISGDRGAPLLENELDIINKDLERIIPFMDADGLAHLKKFNFSEIDPSDGELVTTCREDGACVFVVYDDGKTQCAIELANAAGKIDFKKPISCHLYPIRAAKYGDYTVLNYHKWDICSPACNFGESLNEPMYRFLKEPLIRKMGPDWYEELEAVAKDWSEKSD